MSYKVVFILALLSITTTHISAQYLTNRLIFNGQAGYKLLGIVGPPTSNTLPNTCIKNNPVWHGTLDYEVDQTTSVGIAYGVHTTDEIFTSGVNANVVVGRRVRTDVALRLLMLYGNEDNLDLYSGIRIGYKMDDLYPDTAAPVSSFNTNDRMTFGLMLIGMRYWATDYLAFTMEVNFGRPFIANIGIATQL